MTRGGTGRAAAFAFLLLLVGLPVAVWILPGPTRPAAPRAKDATDASPPLAAPGADPPLPESRIARAEVEPPPPGGEGTIATKLPPPPPETGEIFGQVVDPSGQPVADAFVELAVERLGLDEEEEERDSVSSARTDKEGNYSLEPRAVGTAAVRVDAPLFEPASQPIHVPDRSTRQRIDFQVVPKPLTLIRGRLVDPAGAPLPALVVQVLFFGASDPVQGAGARGFSGSSWIYALTEPFCPGMWGRRIRGESAKIQAESATFEIAVPQGFARLVTATFRDEVVAEKPWQDGDGDFELRVDFQSLLRGLGNLLVEVRDAASEEPIPGASVRLRRPRGDFETGAARGGGGRGFPFPFPMVASGSYVLEGGAPGYAENATRVEVRARETVREVLRLSRPGSVRLLLLPTEGWPSDLPASTLEYRTPDGTSTLRRSTISHLSGSAAEAALDGLPSGPGLALLAGNVLRVRVESSTRRDVEFPLRRPRRLKVRFHPRRDRVEPGGFLGCEVRLLALGTVPVCEETRRLRVREDGSCLFSLRAPPGDYALELQVCRGKGIRRGVTVGEGDATEVRVESP
ncbi:MAG TPA: carboxypeptidase regulatory-like domain-containing protein [Planctomycetota bacterium]|jgi:hypothetical protein|nr:carboxypeptidase regulatory-like domain-containing protein [Planctomycetota bacterium]